MKLFKKIFILILFLLNCHFIGAQCSMPLHPDYPALMALYNSTGGATWTKNTGWKEGKLGTKCDPCKSWYGVKCDANNRVVELALNDNKLNGPIPSEISGLSQLKKFIAYSNNITGNLPVEIGDMISLEKIDLYYNKLGPTIPEALYKLENLKELTLSYNKYTGNISEDFQKLNNLTFLSLDGNTFTGKIPIAITKLKNIQHLSIGSNMLSGEIPDSITTLPNLQFLYLYNNRLTGQLPNNIGNLSNLLSFSVNKNNLSGEIPASFKNLFKIQNVFLGNNNFKGKILELLKDLPFMHALEVNNNQFIGDIPIELANNPKLYTLDLSYNQFTGSIHKEFGDKAFYNDLQLNNNKLSGCLDSNLIKLCDKANVNFSFNQQLPWQGDLTKFCATNGSKNKQVGAPCRKILFGGEQINESCECAPKCLHPDYLPLIELYINTGGSGWTKKTGWTEGAAGNNCDPCTWYGIGCDSMKRVTSIGLISNKLQGTLPASIGDLTHLKNLSLADNKLVGKIPSTIGNLTKLEKLYLSYNSFTDTIPSSIGNLTNLADLSMASNALSGKIPSSIGNLKKLAILSLNENKLSGTIPIEITTLTELKSIIIRGNTLEGTIPEEISKLKKLKQLWVEYNKLSGNIPASFGDFDTIQIFMQGNNFSGCLDAKLLNLCKASIIDISFNPLLPWQGDWGKFCSTDGSASAQQGAFCGIGGSGEMADCNCRLSNETCFTKDGILCKQWLRDTISKLQCTEIGSWTSSFSIGSAKYKEDPVVIISVGFKVVSEVGVTNFIYTCDGQLLEKCTYSLGISCGDSATIYSQLLSPPTYFFDCRKDVLPNCSNLKNLDYDALTALYHATKGENWKVNTNWKEGIADTLSNPCEWYGIVCNTDQRVIAIDLDNNDLKGELQNSICSLFYLESLQLKSNELTGALPNQLYLLKNLKDLNIASNMFLGTLPSSIAKMKNLQFLNAENNNFDGSLPSALLIAPVLSKLNLSNNKFTGLLPAVSPQNTKLKSLLLSNNNFSGCIDGSFKALCGSVTFNFSGNPFLPWSGNFNLFCNTDGMIDQQYGKPCNDGNVLTVNDSITSECACAGKLSTNTASIEEVILDYYPNPVSDFLYFSGQFTLLEYIVINATGETVLHNTAVQNSVDCRSLPNGLYALISRNGARYKFNVIR